MTDLASVKVRPARPEDAALLAALIHELAAYERAPESCHATADAVATQLFGPRPAAEALVAEVDGEPAGFALFFPCFSTWECAPGLYLEDLFVRPALRGRGAGRTLLLALTRIAVDRGWRRLDLSVLDWNAPAIAFYEALGARPQSEWTTFRLEAKALASLAGSDH
jgi:GNAT superfamily N-acetyltransferase